MLLVVAADGGGIKHRFDTNDGSEFKSTALCVRFNKTVEIKKASRVILK